MACSFCPKDNGATKIVNKLQSLLTHYNDYIIPVNQAISLQASVLRADAKQEGRIVHLADALIASTAKVNNWIVATRNTNDFIDSGVEIIDPWTL